LRLSLTVYGQAKAQYRPQQSGEEIDFLIGRRSRPIKKSSFYPCSLEVKKTYPYRAGGRASPLFMSDLLLDENPAFSAAPDAAEEKEVRG